MLDENTHIDTDPAAAPAPSPTPAIEGPGAPASSPAAAPEPSPTPAPSPTDGQPGASPSGQRLPPGQPTATPAAPEPWSFRADRQSYFVEGSRLDAAGNLTIPKGSVELVRQLLAEGVAHRGSWQQERGQYQARIDALEASVETHPDILRARAFNERLNQLMQQGPDAMAAWLDKFEQNREVLKAQAENAVLTQRYEAAEKDRTSAAEDAEARELAPIMEQSLQGVIEELTARFPSVDGGALYGRLMQHYQDRVFYEVDAKERRRGLESGEVQIGQSRDGKMLYVMDRGLVEDEFQHWASLSGGAASAARTAVTQNAAALAAGAPPVAGGGAGGANQPSPVRPLPKTQEEFEKWFAGSDWKESFPAVGP